MFAAVALRTNAGIAARQRLAIQDNHKSRDLLQERRAAIEAKAREDAALREAARQARFSEWMREAHNGRPSAKRIIQGIAREHGFTYEDLIGSCRKTKLIAARFHAIWEVKREHPNMSTITIGRHFGGRDHSSVHHALQHWPEKAAKLGILCEPLERQA